MKKLLAACAALALCTPIVATLEEQGAPEFPAVIPSEDAYALALQLILETMVDDAIDGALNIVFPPVPTAENTIIITTGDTQTNQAD